MTSEYRSPAQKAADTRRRKREAEEARKTRLEAAKAFLKSGGTIRRKKHVIGRYVFEADGKSIEMVVDEIRPLIGCGFARELTRNGDVVYFSPEEKARRKAEAEAAAAKKRRETLNKWLAWVNGAAGTKIPSGTLDEVFDRIASDASMGLLD